MDELDWELLEYRPGRYVKLRRDGQVLGKASEDEVRAWFARRGQPQVTARTTAPPKPAVGHGQPSAGRRDQAREDLPEGAPSPSDGSRSDAHRASPPRLARGREPVSVAAPESNLVPDRPAGQRTEAPSFSAQESILEEPGREAKLPAEPVPGRTRSTRVQAVEEPAGFPSGEAVGLPPILGENADGAEAGTRREKSPERTDAGEAAARAGPDTASAEAGAAMPAWIGASGTGTPVGDGGQDAGQVLEAGSAPAVDTEDTSDLWLWVDPRVEPGFSESAFDVAAFLRRAAERFASKGWTGGQRPGRLAIHPDQATRSLEEAADALGIEVLADRTVSPGTYRLGMAQAPAED